jgi:N-acetylmuramoyl-L-alanine amidase
MPATLVELGFITNPVEAEMMATNPGLYAQGVYNGILSFFGML